MKDICFEMEEMHLAVKDCLEVEGKVKEDLYAMQEFAKKLKQGIPSFIEYGQRTVRQIHDSIRQVQALIREVEQKSAGAQSQKQQELPPPAKPSVPADATPQQKADIEAGYRSQVRQVEEKNRQIQQQNQRIDAFVSKCSDAKSELETIVSSLHQLEASAKDETERTVSAANEASIKVQEAANQDTRINSAMRQFNDVFDLIYQNAQAIAMMEPHSIRSYSYIDKQFVIRNGRSRISKAVSFHFSSESAAARTNTGHAAAADGELCIKERDSAAFFAQAEGARRIRMPSANLHKLGGRGFAAEMAQLGYTMVTQDDGATIDANGMIHWEKQDDQD